TLEIVAVGAAPLNGTSRVLTAASVNGQFASVIPQSQFVTVTAIYGATFVDVQVATRFAQALGATANRAAVGAALD
ncbi:hypothetical protein, partial [Stenotrophomonas maltophilia]|uniref:hypothetical protein n=1 Tax=Stenotrophomonas maltophilia TaxID=40324 RepID=UPI0013D972D1